MALQDAEELHPSYQEYESMSLLSNLLADPMQSQFYPLLLGAWPVGLGNQNVFVEV